jgi:hypothetical protein
VPSVAGAAASEGDPTGPAARVGSSRRRLKRPASRLRRRRARRRSSRRRRDRPASTPGGLYAARRASSDGRRGMRGMAAVAPRWIGSGSSVRGSDLGEHLSLILFFYFTISLAYKMF